MAFNISYTFEAVDQYSAVARKIQSQTKSVEKQVNRLSQSFRKAGSSISKMGRGISLKLGVPLGIFSTMAFRTAVDFEKSMNMVGAVTQSTSKQFGQLEKQSRKLGATTMFTAKQTAEAMKFMGMAGNDVTEIMGGLPLVLQLAASAQIDMGRSADIVTNVMKAYTLQTSELGHVNDVLVKAFTSSNVNLTQLAQAIKMAGATVVGANISLEETVSVLGTLGNVGVQATMAGRGFRAAVKAMMAPTSGMTKIMKRLNIHFRDTHGKMKNIIDIIEELNKKNVKSQDIFRMFGTVGGNVMSTLVRSSEDLRKLNTEIANTGNIAERVAKAQMKGLPGASLKLMSAYTEMSIALTKSVEPSLIKLLALITDTITKFNESSSSVKHFIALSLGMALAFGPILMGLGKFLLMMSLLVKFAPGLLGLGAAFKFMWRSALGPIALIGPLIIGLTYLYKKFEMVRDILNAIGKVLYYLFYPLIKLGQGIGWLAKKLGLFHKEASYLEKLKMPTWTETGAQKMATQPSVAAYGMTNTQKVLSTLNINVADKGQNIENIDAMSEGKFNLNLGTNMAY